MPSKSTAMPNLEARLRAQKSLLKKTDTRITTPDGKVYIESSNESTLVASSPGFVCDMTPDLQVGEIIPGKLFVGSQDVVADAAYAHSFGFTHILNVGGSNIRDLHPEDFIYKTVELLDLPDQSLDGLDVCFDFIDSGSAVFVHCNAGVSRAPTVVVAYLIRRKGFRFAEAMDIVKKARPTANPNQGFIEKLKCL